MIPRYSRPDMVAVWSPETKFRIWFEIEAHACDAMADLGTIPRENADAVWKAKDVEFDVARIDEIEAVTKHDVIAFLTHLAEQVGSDEARFVHQGMTSSDVLDTCFNVQLTRAADLLLVGMDKLLAALKKRALEHKDTVRVGRSHGIHAEPTTMGLTFARFYAEMDRILALVDHHSGPIVIAGDFNTWNQARVRFIETRMQQAGRNQVECREPHYIKRFGRHRLDHLFYRGLTLEDAWVVNTARVSDHNPLIAQFNVSAPA